MANSENAIIGEDSRLKKSTNSESRQDRSSADSERTQKDGTVFSAPERVSNFRDEWAATALPTPPAIPGFHQCWLSSTNSYDPIYKRMRMGYVPVRADELPGFEHLKMRSGEFEGIVSCNEMLLFKIRSELYQEMMEYFHHEKPMEDEQMIKASAALTDAQKRDVAQSIEEDGFKQLAKQVKAPAFT
jgi:hypothetical protein